MTNAPRISINLASSTPAARQIAENLHVLLVRSFALAASAAYLRSNWSRIPETFPTHCGSMVTERLVAQDSCFPYSRSPDGSAAAVAVEYSLACILSGVALTPLAAIPILAGARRDLPDPDSQSTGR